MRPKIAPLPHRDPWATPEQVHETAERRWRIPASFSRPPVESSDGNLGKLLVFIFLMIIVIGGLITEIITSYPPHR